MADPGPLGTPGDVSAFLGDQRLGDAATVPPGEVTVRLERAAHRAESWTAIAELGATLRVEPPAFEPIAGWIDLSKLPAGLSARVGTGASARALRDGDTLAPGEYLVVLSNEDGAAPAVRVRVRPGEPTSIPASAWIPPGPREERIEEIVTELSAWEAATPEERRFVARRVARKTRGTTLLRLERFAAAGASHELAVFLHEPTGLEFVLLPAGSFVMGSPPSEPGRNDDETQHAVRLTRPFLIARTECTQAAWDRIGGDDERHRRGDTLPIEGVSWIDVTAWCERAGLRLPTEAEWEYACRGGTTTPFGLGEDIAARDVNFDGTRPYRGSSGRFREATIAVGALPSNAFGLHDTHGNVWEWCRDAYVPDYELGGADDPLHEADDGDRVSRGGSWRHAATAQRSANRSGDRPSLRGRSLGFRPALEARLN